MEGWLDPERVGFAFFQCREDFPFAFSLGFEFFFLVNSDILSVKTNYSILKFI